MVVLTELESSSFSDEYELFLSFSSVDTRNGFTDHLYQALLDAGIKTFLDEEEIETGESLKPESVSAIKSSRASIIVLSKNYASSTWCLDELVLILEQQRNSNQIVIPIFYHVKPSDVRKQQSSFGEALARHKRRMIEAETNEEKRSHWLQKIELWERALTQVADLKGKNAKDRKESELIEEVVSDIQHRVGVLLSSNTLPLLIGMNYYIEFISSWLVDGPCRTGDILTVVGVSGIGKTVLAKYVFQLHSGKFHKSSFIEDINRRCTEQYNGLLDLQKQLHGDISKVIPLQVNDVFVYTSEIENALACTRVLIVLDDIGCLGQLDALLGNKGLHPRSKIIITTKDASLIERCALFNQKGQPEHTLVSLSGLYVFGSLQLLCIHAFKCNDYIKEGYEGVSKELVKYCEGHPLALEVLGRYLHTQDVAYWKASIEALKKEPHSCIRNALQMSFDSLSCENDKELFKHIACFFVGKDRHLTETVLNACYIKTSSGITNLINKGLLSIGHSNKLMMHQLIQEMGRDLVHQESPDKPWKRSRLWCHEESFKVLKQEKDTENLLGLALDMRMLDTKNLHGSFELKTESLSGMENLMLLQLNYVHLNGFFEYFPKELRWLCMHGFPLKCVPPIDLPMENLVALDMSYSNIEYFYVHYSNAKPWAKIQKLAGSYSKDKRLLGSLKILDLSFCEQLHSVGGFFELPTLERLILRNCISLIEVCESIEQCVELAYIDLSYCNKLRRLPISMGKLKKVKTLLLDACFPREFIVKAIPSDLKFITTSISSSLVRMSLANNNLSNESFPVSFSSLSMLKELCLDNNPIVSIPDCVRSLPRLHTLSLERCDMLTSIEFPPVTLRSLSISLVKDSYKKSLVKIKYDPKMKLKSLEFEPGIVKIQPMADVEEKVLHSLGWRNSEFLKERCLETYSLDERSEKSQTQIYYEFGIFSTIYEGKEIPAWITRRYEGPSISFIIPSSLNKLRGLNFCCVVTLSRSSSLELPMIEIRNNTKNHKWIYVLSAEHVILGGRCLCLLSHWMFGQNEMESGDHITIAAAPFDVYQLTKECGFSLVYDDNGKT